MKTKTKQSLRDKIPGYVNHSLSTQERDEVEKGLSQDPQARVDLEAWRKIETAMINQPQRMPSSLVRQRLVASLHATRQFDEKRVNWEWGIVSGAFLTIAIMVLLWLAVRPGVVLQWSHERDGVTVYRIYRANQGSSQYTLIKEIPAQAGQMHYSFVDGFIFPGKNYVYSVEGLRSNGEKSLSSVVNGRAVDVIPAQLALLVASLVLGYGIVMFIRIWPAAPLRRNAAVMF
jgi:hypothetical protein